MKSKLILGLLSLFMMFSMTSCMEKVDAGCEGIKVNLYGSDKGQVTLSPNYLRSIIIPLVFTIVRRRITSSSSIGQML
nr:MAG TPA: protein of unknown function (DUF5016) [Crassvirales sp.]